MGAVKAMMADDRHGIGGNYPPEPVDPFPALQIHVADLADKARGSLTGAVVTAEQAEQVESLLDEAREAERAVEQTRVAEKEPHLVAGRAVDQRYKPLATDLATVKASAVAALTPYRQRLDDERKRLEAAERCRAEKLTEIARNAHAQADPADMEAREDAERLLKAAAAADREANRAAKASTGLRAVWSATVTDRTLALRHYNATQPQAFDELLATLADRDARGARAPVPGVAFVETKVAR